MARLKALKWPKSIYQGKDVILRPPVLSNKGGSEFHKAFEEIIHKIIEKS